ncbi:unnamed protein product [Strongylus vulgaris]|uniref:Reverse transcriptase domain-containing protein n=1 Tax=Strongylus vulgaris TaxID=40348 RepID=A0A3P7J837_STRVU|nr:unnamed protein product [Strongylus vulgaris]
MAEASERPTCEPKDRYWERSFGLLRLPQAGCKEEEKDAFWQELDDHSFNTTKEILLLGGSSTDMLEKSEMVQETGSGKNADSVVFLGSRISRKMPETGTTIPIWKNKGGVADCTAYRPIRLMSPSPKIFEGMLETRIKIVEMSANQSGFVKGMSTADAIHTGEGKL